MRQKGKSDITIKSLHKDIDFPEDTGIIIENMNMLPLYTGFDNLKLLAEIK